MLSLLCYDTLLILIIINFLNIKIIFRSKYEKETRIERLQNVPKTGSYWRKTSKSILLKNNF